MTIPTTSPNDSVLAPPLAGVKVLDFTRHMSGPYGTVFLADYGADVIKIESLPDGDPSRTTGVRVDDKVSATFLMWNRGKRSLALDLRKPESLDIIYRLAATADVVVENYRPGVADKIGIGYERLQAVNPGIIYVELSAFGRGMLEPYPGTDPVVQAMSGVMSVTGEVGGPPLLVGVPIADFTGAMMVSQAVMLGLLARQQHGIGQKVELSMLYGLMSALTTRLATYWATGQTPRRNGGAHSVVMPYQVFEASDGYLVAGVWNGANVMWPMFCEALELPELVQESRYSTNEDRLNNKEELAKILETQFKTNSVGYWQERFQERGVLFGPVMTFDGLMEHPQIVESGIFGDVPHPTIGSTRQLGPVIGLARTPGGLERHPPLLGEHTVEILRGAGYSTDDIETLADDGVIRTSRAANDR